MITLEEVTKALGYKEYEVLLNQTTTNPPVATILKNTLGAVPVWGYTSVGVYTLTLSGAFTANKVAIYIGRNTGTPGEGYEIYRVNNNVIRLDSALFNSGTGGWDFANGRLTDTSLHIKIYN